MRLNDCHDDTYLRSIETVVESRGRGATDGVYLGGDSTRDEVIEIESSSYISPNAIPGGCDAQR